MVCARTVNDGEERAAFIGEQHASRPEEEVPLPGDRRLGVVPLGRVVEHVGQEVDRLIALQVDDAQRVAGRQYPRPGRQRRHGLVENHACFDRRHAGTASG